MGTRKSSGENSEVITFITWLRSLAAILITNAHYTNIYPMDIIANGGLIGDILFFAVSGYCLTNIRTSFIKWYGKRFVRILPAVILITVIYMLFGQYNLAYYADGTEQTILYNLLSLIGIKYPTFLSWFVYPTYYHFIGSILVLYIPYYFIIKIEKLKKHIPTIMVVIFVIYFVIYLLVYDKSYYHIDTVREPIIRFLFMESMLLGAWFRVNDLKFRNFGKSWVYMLLTFISFLVYFVSKILFSQGILPQLQIFNQCVVFILLYFLFRWFSSIDRCLDHVPKWINKIVTFIANITLEIYLVQYVIIDVIRNLGFAFPFNWILLTALIIASAFLLHFVIDKCTKLLKRGKSK